MSYLQCRDNKLAVNNKVEAGKFADARDRKLILISHGDYQKLILVTIQQTAAGAASWVFHSSSRVGVWKTSVVVEPQTCKKTRRGFDDASVVDW